MVRTYAFNPTYSSNILSRANPHEPVTVKSSVPLASNANGYQNHDERTEKGMRNGSAGQSLDASFSSTASSLASVSTRPVITDDSTTLLGIRSVVIDGQRYYQPIDPQHIVNKSRKSDAPKDNGNTRREQAIDPASLMTAMQMALAAQSANVAMPSGGQFDDEHNPVRTQVYRTISLPEQADAKAAENETSSMIGDLPWARGNPQPRSGKRGTNAWNVGQRTLPPQPRNWLSDLGSTLPSTLPWNSSLRAPQDLYQPIAADPFARVEPPRPVHYPVNLSNSYGSFYTDPALSTYSRPPDVLRYASTSEDRAKLEKEQHKLELMQQVEDNRRRKMMEKQKEWEEDERQRIRNEIYNERVRREMEEEKRREREKAMAAELKAAQLEEARRRALEAIQREKREAPRSPRRNDRLSIPGTAESTSALSRSRPAEWWEKKPGWSSDDRGKSPIIPALRSKENTSSTNSIAGDEQRLPRSSSQDIVARRPDSRPIRPARSQSRSSRHSYQPSIGSRAGSNHNRLESSFGRLSATHKSLQDEVDRLQSALDKNRYGNEAFK